MATVWIEVQHHRTRLPTPSDFDFNLAHDPTVPKKD
jgi:hypothetical protein